MNSKQPSEILILRGLTAEITEKMILEIIQELDYYPEYVRLIKDKSTGKSKGIAIIRFETVTESASFLELHPTIEIDEITTWFEFGFEHSEDDWTCKICHNINFRSREKCFKCSNPKLATQVKQISSGSDDISVNPTRFLLLRNLDAHLTAQKIFDKLSIFESNLKRVWLLLERETKVPQNFGFLEFLSIQCAEDFINRQNNLGVPLKLDQNEIELTFGRDLSLLAQSLSDAINTKITYWNSNYEFSEYPAHAIIIPETPSSDNAQVLGIPSKRMIAGAFPNLSRSAPPKKIQLQLKTWTEKAIKSEIAETSDRVNFVPEESSSRTKNKFIDETFLCCLLCDIKFNSESELMDHAQNSVDHAEKFEEYWKQSVNEDSKDYRDRAAERRDAFCVKEEEIKKKIQQESQMVKVRSDSNSSGTFNTRTETVTEDDSVGAKLLKKMGWKAGLGLGKSSTGIIEPIQAKTLEHSGAGIGASRLISAEEIKSKSYNEIVKDERKRRYNE